MLSLEKLCLDLIVQKFERFYSAYTESNDDNLQRNFDFLQRRFSTEVLSKLYLTNILKEEFLELLINEHLDYLVDIWLSNSRYWYSIKDIFFRLPNLKRIYFCDCNDKTLEILAKFCPKLIEISVSWCNYVTDNGVKYLCTDTNGAPPCPELKNLFIKNTQVTDSGVECLLRTLPFLERIDYANVPRLIHSIHEENLYEFKTLKSYDLVELNFLHPEFRNLPNRTNILKTCLSVCPKLKHLSCYISDKEQLDLLTNINIKKLELKFADLNFNIDNFLKLKIYNITSLTISYCTMSISALGLNLPILENFSAEHVIFLDEDNDDFKLNFSSLTECTLAHIEPSSQKAIYLLLSPAPKLESASFSDCLLSFEMKTQILLWCKRPSAKMVRLTDIDAVSQMEFLEDIHLKFSSLKDMFVFR